MNRIVFAVFCMLAFVLQVSATPVFSNIRMVNERSGADGFGGKPVKGGHSKGKRESTKNKHENADARRKKDQAKAE